MPPLAGEQHKANNMPKAQRVDALPAIDMPQGRISPRLRQAIEFIVIEGQSVKDAAIATGYSRNALAVALRRSHVVALKRDIITTFMQSGTDVARYTLVELCRNSKSDDVKHKAARTLLEMSGELGQASDKQGEIGAVHVHIHRSGRLSQPHDDEVETLTIQPSSMQVVNQGHVDHNDNQGPSSD